MIAALGLLTGWFAAGVPAKSNQHAYDRPELDLIYNLLFCDNPELLRPKTGAPIGPTAVLLSDPPRIDELRKIAEDETAESRVRAVAYLRLRAAKAEVPKGQLLGVIVEVPQARGLDALAVYVDGRMRYINQSGRVAVFESTLAGMAAKQAALLRAAAMAITRIGPWDKPRLPPPKRGNVRLSFLVSDGLYFGEGPFGAISRDAIGGPVLTSATDLLLAIVAEGSKPAR